MVKRDVVPVRVPHLREDRYFLLNLGDLVIGGVQVNNLLENRRQCVP